MITLALTQLIYFVCLEAPFTGGENGLQDVPRGSLLGWQLKSDIAMYYLVLAIFGAVFLFIRRVAHSPIGHAVG
jgi:branched-chain amino acid transport system permease protein